MWKDECKKYGELRYLFVDPEIEGNMWAKFNDIHSAVNTHKNLNDRYFGSKKMTLFFVKEVSFKRKFAI